MTDANDHNRRWAEIVARQETQDDTTLSYDALFLRRRLWTKIRARLAAGGRRVIDIGANAGYARAWLGERVAAYFGVEPSPLPLARCADPELRQRLVRGAGETLPARDGKFDTVLLVEVLDHSLEPGRVLREAARVTAAGALAFVTVANRGTLVRGFYCWYLRRRGKLGPDDPHFEKHTFHFSRAEMRQLLTENGWRIARETGIGYLPIPRKLGTLVPAALLKPVWTIANFVGEALLPDRCDGMYFEAVRNP